MANGRAKGDKSTWRDNLAVAMAAFSLGVAMAAGVVSYLAFHEDRSVNVEGFAIANTLGSTPNGYGVVVSIINDSLRPVIVRSVSVMVDGVSVTRASEYLSDPRSLNDQSTRGDESMQKALPFPLAIPARGTRSVGALFGFQRADEVFFARRSSPALRGAKTFCRALYLAPDAQMHDIALRINFDPGGTTDVPIKMIGPLDGGNQWFFRVLNRSSPRAFEVRRKFAATSAYRLMTVRVWRNSGGLIRQVSLPLFGGSAAFPSFAPLPDGRYRAALFEGSRIVAGGRFDVPLQGRFSGLISPTRATESNTQCELFRHPERRAVTPQPLPRHPIPQ